MDTKLCNELHNDPFFGSLQNYKEKYNPYGSLSQKLISLF